MGLDIHYPMGMAIPIYSTLDHILVNFRVFWLFRSITVNFERNANFTQYEFDIFSSSSFPSRAVLFFFGLEQSSGLSHFWILSNLTNTEALMVLSLIYIYIYIYIVWSYEEEDTHGIVEVKD